MWELRKKLIDVLYRNGFINKPFLAYRRGGVYYDKIFGPWRFWARNYYPEKLLVESLGYVRVVCPNDGAPMEFSRKGVLCSFCSLYIPESILYEALENGIAEFMVKSGLHKGRVYRIIYKGCDRFDVERIV